MNCDVFTSCPSLYQCQYKLCVHDPLLTWSFNLLLSAILIPIIAAFNNKVGISSIWISYLVFISILFYLPSQVWNLISGVAMGASLTGILFKYQEIKQQNQDVGIHFYYANVCVIPLVLGLNFGIKLTKLLPFIISVGLGVTAVITFTIFFANLYKEIRSDEKIADGSYKKLLPTRMTSPKKQKKFSVQMSCIQEVQSEEDARSFQLKNSDRIKFRQQLLVQTKQQSNTRHITILVILYITYECLCLGLNRILQLFAITDELILLLSFLIAISFMLIGQFCLYKFYIEQKILQENLYSVKLGIDMNQYTMIKLITLSFLGGILQGLFGIGYCELILIFMTTMRLPLGNAISTTTVLSLFVSLTYTFSTLSCGLFNVVNYFGLLGYTLICTALFQLLLKNWLHKQTDNPSQKSNLTVILISLQVIAGITMICSLGFIHVRFGSSSYLEFGEVSLC